MSLNLEYLAAYVEVYEAGSFAQAASKSVRHASTYSRKISALEDELGFELFIRHSRSLQPTEQARALYDHAKSLLIEADLFSDKIKTIYVGHSGETTIVVDIAVAELGVIESIAKLIKAMPALQVTIKTADTESAREALITGEADMALVLTSYSLPAQVNSRRFMEFPIVRVASKDYLSQFDISDQQTITPSKIRGMRQVVMAPLRNLGIESQVYSQQTISADSLRVAMDLVQQGVGWCNLPKAMAERAIEDGDLLSFSVEDDYRLAWSVELMWPTENIYDPIRDKLMDMLI